VKSARGCVAATSPGRAASKKTSEENARSATEMIQEPRFLVVSV
jgi:hypothetical protein